jgi:hypothetical protein
VFNQLLDRGIDVELMMTMPDIVKLNLPDGTEVESSKSFDPTGDPLQTSTAISAPFGPAIVIKPLNQLQAGTKYTLVIDASRIKNRSGTLLTKDVNGAIKPSYDIQMEALFPLDGIAPDFTAAETQIAPDDFFQLFLNSSIDPNVSGADVEVKMAGQTVTVSAFADCDAGPTALDIVRTSSTGVPIAWDTGDYTITVNVKGENGTSVIGSSPFGGTLEGAFSVSEEAETTNPIDALTLPADCGSEE